MYNERGYAAAYLAEALMRKNFNVTGYSPYKHEVFDDYCTLPNWSSSGIAIHPDYPEFEVGLSNTRFWKVMHRGTEIASGTGMKKMLDDKTKAPDALAEKILNIIKNHGVKRQVVAAQPMAAQTSAGITISINHKQNGIEIRFPKRPEDSMLTALKSAGFRWSGFNKCWYTKNTPENLEIAKAVVGIQEVLV